MAVADAAASIAAALTSQVELPHTALAAFRQPGIQCLAIALKVETEGQPLAAGQELLACTPDLIWRAHPPALALHASGCCFTGQVCEWKRAKLISAASAARCRCRRRLAPLAVPACLPASVAFP